MAQNNCTPSTVYGPYSQTLFLGCSVLSFNANAGWNEQSSEVTIELVQDPCVGVKTYVPTNLGVYAPTSASLADPGFTEPNLGAPAYFRVDNFEYAGLIQAYTRKDGPDGNPIYSVKLTDPRVILDHSQLILDEYEGPVGAMHNVFNVFSYLESQDADCPPLVVNGVKFGAPAGGFGGANKTGRGIPWNSVKCAVQTLIGNDYGPITDYGLGGIFYRGGNANGYGEIASSPYARYILDISEVPFSSTDYRITGPTMSVSELISEVCDAAGCDYYVELLPTPWSLSPSTTALVIKVRVVVRTNQPAMGVITNFVTSHSIAAGGNGVITDSVGRELRTEPNNAFVIGGKVRSVYELEKPFYNPYDNDAIIPFWGFDNDGSPIKARYKAGCLASPSVWSGPQDWEVHLDFRRLNSALMTELSYADLGIGSGRNPLDPLDAVPGLDKNSFGWVWEGELRAALGGFEQFCDFVLNEGPLCNPNNCVFPNQTYCQKSLMRSYLELCDIKPTTSLRPNHTNFPVGFNQWQINIVQGRTGNPFGPDDIGLRDAKTVYEFLHNYANEFYGKQWLVPIPFACFDYDSDTEQLVWSDEPSTEGGWSEQANVIGLANPSFSTDFFAEADGKINTILRWEQNQNYAAGVGMAGPSSPPLTGIDASALNVSEYLTNITGELGVGVNPPYGYLWAKADIDPSWVTGQVMYEDDVVSGIWARCQIGAPICSGYGVLDIASSPDMVRIRSGEPDSLMGGITQISNVMGGQPAGYFAKRALPPTAAAVPILSNTQTYGPWYAFADSYGGSGVPGSVAMSVDEGLTPWEYGGSGYMKAGGLAQVANAVTAMQYGERGEVTVPGYPVGGLGGALNGSVSIYSGRALYVGSCVASGLTAPYNYVSGLGISPSAAYTGPASISNINVTVSPQGVTTSYTVSSFTPVFGRFSKGNAERIKQIGQNRLSSNRQRRAQNSLLSRSLMRQIARVNDSKRVGVGSSAYSPRSASVLFAGKILSEDRKRKVVIAPDAKSLALYTDYDITSMMSMDGLMRPVSKTGGISGNLPAMKSGAGNYCAESGIPHPNRHLSIAPPPPVSGISPIVIAANYLDPLADPVSNYNFSYSYQATGTFNTGVIASVAGGTGDPCTYASGSGYGPALGSLPMSGHDWESVARSTLLGLSGINATGGDGYTGTYSMMIAGNQAKYTEDYRFLALRGPLVMQGWGYDIYGKPIPNAKGWSGDLSFVEGEAPADSGSVHQTGYEGLTDRFHANWLADSNNWPVAPVDLRYDRKREVWTVPPPFRMYQVETMTNIGAGQVGNAYVLNVDDLFDQDGNTPPPAQWTTCGTGVTGQPLTGADGACTGLVCNTGGFPAIELNNWTDTALSSGAKTTAYYDTVSCSYWPLAGGGGGGDYDYWTVSDITGVVQTGSGWNPNDVYRDSKVYNKGNVSFSGCSGTEVSIGRGIGYDELGRFRNVVSICASSSAGGYGGDVKFINGISCSGSNIVATSGTMHFSDGLLKGVDQ